MLQVALEEEATRFLGRGHYRRGALSTPLVDVHKSPI
jgi:hypothetical protein